MTSHVDRNVNSTERVLVTPDLSKSVSGGRTSDRVPETKIEEPQTSGGVSRVDPRTVDGREFSGPSGDRRTVGKLKKSIREL